MKNIKKMISGLLTVAMTVSIAGANMVPVVAATSVKNIIYMIPDGGGMAPFYLADAVKQDGGFDSAKYPDVTPVKAGEMYIKDYLVGAETTYSADNAVTDSAASGTALSTGYKTNNGYIGIDPEKKPHANILEACQDLGKNTGIVVTYEWTNATPAAFSAHDISRNNMKTMSEQIVNQGIDIVFGNTHSDFSFEEWFTDEALEHRGYDVIKDKTALAGIKAGDRAWAKFSSSFFYDIERDASTPTLLELTKAAITALDDGNENGFFLMVEGSAVDGGGHASDARRMVSEFLAFDAACEYAIEFAKGRDDTIVVIAPDHDTGGIKYNYSNLDSIVDKIQVGTNPSMTWEGNGGHTARNGGVFMYVPEGVPYPAGIDAEKKAQVAEEFYSAYGDFSKSYPIDPVNTINNIDIPRYLTSLLGVDLDDVTDKLYVDVTDRGTYDQKTEVFTFTDEDISIKRNSSTATVGGFDADLGGEIALYIEGRFYVPESIFEVENELDIAEGIMVYADYNTGKIQYSGSLKTAGIDVSTVITRPDMALNDDDNTEEILYMGQTKTDYAGNYSFNAKVDRIAGEYTLITNYTDNDSPSVRTFALKNTIPTLTVESDGEQITDFAQLKAGDMLDITLSGFDLEDEYQALVVVAQYNEGRLISAKNMPVSGGSIYYGDQIEKEAQVAEAVDSVKIFYWSMDTIMPLIGTYTID